MVCECTPAFNPVECLVVKEKLVRLVEKKGTLSGKTKKLARQKLHAETKQKRKVWERTGQVRSCPCSRVLQLQRSNDQSAQPPSLLLQRCYTSDENKDNLIYRLG